MAVWGDLCACCARRLGSSREVTACQSVGTGRNSRALGATPTTTTCSRDNWEQHTWERRDRRVPGHLVLGVLQVVPQAPDFGSVGQQAPGSLGAWEEKHLCDKTESALSERGSFSLGEETLAGGE